MAVSRSLLRLRRVLHLEEEQSKLALESALSELRQLERALMSANNQAREGRTLVAFSVQTGELHDRLAGLEEERAASRRTAALALRIGDLQLDAESLRVTFLAKRVECRQVETLIRESEVRDANEGRRRSQQSLDSWYLNRFYAAALARTSTNAVHPSSEDETETFSSVPFSNVPAETSPRS